VFLERGIFATVAPVSLGIGQMLPAVQFDNQVQLVAKQIDFRRGRSQCGPTFGQPLGSDCLVFGQSLMFL